VTEQGAAVGLSAAGPMPAAGPRRTTHQGQLAAQYTCTQRQFRWPIRAVPVGILRSRCSHINKISHQMAQLSRSQSVDVPVAGAQQALDTPDSRRASRMPMQPMASLARQFQAVCQKKRENPPKKVPLVPRNPAVPRYFLGMALHFLLLEQLQPLLVRQRLGKKVPSQS
jgi:hypothetical protein